MIRQILSNIVAFPDEPKFRSLLISVVDRTLSADDILLLKSIGFTKQDDSYKMLGDANIKKLTEILDSMKTVDNSVIITITDVELEKLHILDASLIGPDFALERRSQSSPPIYEINDPHLQKYGCQACTYYRWRTVKTHIVFDIRKVFPTVEAATGYHVKKESIAFNGELFVDQGKSNATMMAPYNMKDYRPACKHLMCFAGPTDVLRLALGSVFQTEKFKVSDFSFIDRFKSFCAIFLVGRVFVKIFLSTAESDDTLQMLIDHAKLLINAAIEKAADLNK